MKSYKTTIAGILTILAGVSSELLKLFDANPTTNPDYSLVIAVIIAGIGLITAKDHNVSGGTK